MVVAASASLAPLEHGCAAEFSTPDDQGVLKHAALLEISEQGPGGAVSVFAADFHVFIKVTVVIPAAVLELDEAHAFFRKAAGE